jgi:hypothetical protein
VVRNNGDITVHLLPLTALPDPPNGVHLRLEPVVPAR